MKKVELRTTRKKMLETLQEIASKGETITYSELANQYRYNLDDPRGFSFFCGALTDIGRYELQNKRPPLNALVVSSSSGSNKKPNIGFFNWYVKHIDKQKSARDLMNERDFYEGMKQRCYREWGAV